MASASRFTEADFQLVSSKSGIPLWLLKSNDFTDANFQGLLDRVRAGEPALNTPTGAINQSVQTAIKESPSQVFINSFVSGVKEDLDPVASGMMKALKYGALALGGLVVFQILGFIKKVR